MGVVLDERLFDEEREVVLGELQRTAVRDLLGELLGDGMRDGGDEATVAIVENIALLAGEEEVGEGVADFVGDVGEIEEALLGAAGDLDLRAFDGGKHLSPGEVGLLLAGRGDEALEGAIFFESEFADH